MRVVLDPNVLISALISSHGAPARILERWRSGAFELIVSRSLVDELERALEYPKLRKYFLSIEAASYIEIITAGAIHELDPTPYPLRVRSRDPNDDYLLALASQSSAALVTGDADLLELHLELPILTPGGFLNTVDGDTSARPS